MSRPVLLFVILLMSGCSPSYQTTIPEKNSIVTTSFSSNSNQIEIKPSKNDKLLIKEYTYSASEDDSKNSSRKKALEQIKLLLSEEVGVHIESYLEINKLESNGVARQDVRQEIQSLSASITKINILDEKWDGSKYYLMAEVRVNPQQTMTLLLEAIKAKSAKNELDRLNLIIAGQQAQLSQSKGKEAELRKELVRQELLYEARQSERIKVKNNLIRTNEERIQQEKDIADENEEIKLARQKIDVAKKRISSSMKKSCMTVEGMTLNEVVSALGTPDGTDIGVIEHGFPGKIYYGKVSLYFTSGMLQRINGCN